MRFRNFIFWMMILSLAAAACGGGKSTPQELPTPQIKVNSAPKVEDAAKVYLSDWESGNYSAMYDQLSSASQQAVTLD
jgi:hypothetical protein